MVELVVPGRPVPKQRPRHSNGVTWTPERTLRAEEAIAWEVRAQGISLGTAPLRVELAFYGAHPSADVDNLAKLVLDGLQKGGAFENDKQVVRLAVARHDVDHDGPRTLIGLEVIE